jgi:peptidoglycan hydrolase CwlO-like protein
MRLLHTFAHANTIDTTSLPHSFVTVPEPARLDEHDQRFDRIDAELRDIRSEIKSIRADLDDLTDKVENILGYRKAIDHALAGSLQSKSI